VTIDDELYNLLKGLTAPANRVYPVAAPDNVGAGDYIVVQRIATVPENNLDGLSGLYRSRFQVAAISRTFEGARTLLDSVKAAFTGWSARQNLQLSDNPDTQDEDSRLFAASSDFAIWHD
jgi:hypothetical protein